MAIKERKQITGTEAQIKGFAGHNGVLAYATDTKHLHVLSGTAGTTTKLANMSDIPAPVDISGKADKTYVDTALAKKQAKGDYATSTALTQGLAGKANRSHTHTSTDVTDLNATISNALKPYATTNTVNTGLAKKANASHTHTVSQITDMPKAVLSVNGQTPNDDGNISPSQTGCLPLTGGTLTGGVGHSILGVSKTSGTVTLTANRIHKMNISGATTFSLPAGNASVFTQIKVMVNVTGTPSINWGTSRFFNKKVPSIAAGQYDFYFDYDPTANAWVAGAVPKGVA